MRWKRSRPRCGSTRRSFPLIELGWIYYAVFDDAGDGKQYFEAAIEIARQQTIEAFRGAAQCAEEISGADGRAAVIRRASGFVTAGDLDEPVVET